jgi:hypothetical protein
MRLGKLLRTQWFGFPVGKLIEQQYHMNMTTQSDHDTKDKRARMNVNGSLQRKQHPET